MPPAYRVHVVNLILYALNLGLLESITLIPAQIDTVNRSSIV